MLCCAVLCCAFGEICVNTGTLLDEVSVCGWSLSMGYKGVLYYLSKGPLAMFACYTTLL